VTATQALKLATHRLAADPYLSDTARRDTELLLLHTLSISRASLIADPSRVLTAEQQSAYEAAIARRLRHEPVQYITGHQEFYGLRFHVTPAVLIPRPETEHLVESVLQRLPHDLPLSIADIGVGSGAIAVALATQLPHAHIVALDLSPAALAVAESNVADHHLTSRIRLLHSDLLAGLPHAEQNGHFDAIVSNPPYVPLHEATDLHPQVREHEPATALFAGTDGLEIYRRIIPEAHKAMKNGGLLALEIGHGQQAPLTTLLSGWHDVEFVPDLQGIPRVALARR
jgi:release factor glutamine methyltransferase